MEHVASERISWKAALDKERPLLLPVAHDALTAKIIEQSGFHALQVAGFAVAGARHGLPGRDGQGAHVPGDLRAAPPG